MVDIIRVSRTFVAGQRSQIGRYEVPWEVSLSCFSIWMINEAAGCVVDRLLVGVDVEYGWCEYTTLRLVIHLLFLSAAFVVERLFASDIMMVVV